MYRWCPYCSNNCRTWQTCPNSISKQLGWFRRSLSMGHLSHHNPGLTVNKSDSGDEYASEDIGSSRRQRKGDPMNGDRQAISNNFLASSSMVIELANFDHRQHSIRETRGEIGSSQFDMVEDEDNIDANSGALWSLPETESNHEAYLQIRNGSSGKGSNKGEDDIHSNITSPVVSECHSCANAVPFGNNNGQNEAHPRTIYSYKKDILKWIFVISSLIFEILSAIFQQLSSPHNSGYALISMVISFVALVICISEIIYNCRQEKVTWRRRGKIHWFYYPSPSHKCYGNFKDIVGLVCAILQLIFSTISYIFYRRHVNDPIKVSIFSVIFALGLLLCSKFLNDKDKDEGDRMAENMLP